MGTGGGSSFIRGGTSLLFADVLGDRRLGIAFQAGKRLEDLAVQARYTNRASRWTYGVGVELLPYVDAARSRMFGGTDTGPLLIENAQRERQLHTFLSGLVSYPFHRSMRVELRAGIHTAHYHRATQSRTFSLPDGHLLTEDSDGDALAPRPLRLFETSAALVRDTSVFGAVSPILGTRMRLEVVSARGDVNYWHWLGDYRKYWLLPGRPYSIALRLLHTGRYGSGADDRRLFPMSLRRQAYVRGAETERVMQCDIAQAGTCMDSTLEGSKMLVGQLELRFPLLGALARHLTWGGFPIEGFGFADAGMVWRGDELPSWLGGSRPAVRSAGGGVRVRLGYFVLEAAAAHRFDPTRGGWVIAFNARPPF
jgi:outer membrane protein assembly factor BamA